MRALALLLLFTVSCQQRPVVKVPEAVLLFVQLSNHGETVPCVSDNFLELRVLRPRLEALGSEAVEREAELCRSEGEACIARLKRDYCDSALAAEVARERKDFSVP